MGLSINVLLVISFLMVQNAQSSEFHPTNRRIRRSTRRYTDNSQHQHQEYWLCPDLVCTPLDETCREAEFIVHMYEYEAADGHVIPVTCESCPYCLDMPAQLRSSRPRRGAAVKSLLDLSRSSHSMRRHSSHDGRSRISLQQVLGLRRNPLARCPDQSACPQLPDDCNRIILTDIITGQESEQCATRCELCIDNVEKSQQNED